MIFAFYDLLSKYWVVTVLALLVLLLLILFFLMIYYKRINKEKSFKQNFEATKYSQFSIVIDLEEKIAERYYLYDQANPFERLPLDEFYVRFTIEHSSNLKNWMEDIKTKTDLSTVARQELVMYDKNNVRRIYLAELENYIPEYNKFYFIFKDITDTPQVLRRSQKRIPSISENDYFTKVNERLSVCDEGSSNFFVAIKYQEREKLEKELHPETIKLIYEKIYQNIILYKSDNELLFLANQSIYLFSCSVVNVKKYKKHLKNIISKCSGEYNIVNFTFTITLVAGYTKIASNETMNFDKTLEAAVAANTLMDKGKFAEKIQLYDDELKEKATIKDNKLLVAEKVVTEGLFSLNYVPILGVSRKKVMGYAIQIGLPSALHMEVSEFIGLLKQISFRSAFYTRIFDIVLKHKDALEKPFYLSFDFDDLEKVVEAYKNNKDYSNVQYYFCVEFSTDTLRNNNLIEIERKLIKNKEKNKFKLGITYNTLNTIYLNDKIYSKARVVLLTGQLIEHALDNYKNASLLELYTKVANSYHQEVIGLNVSTLATYEILTHYNVKKIGGYLLTPHIVDGAISDKFLLKKLKDIDSKTY